MKSTNDKTNKVTAAALAAETPAAETPAALAAETPAAETPAALAAETPAAVKGGPDVLETRAARCMLGRREDSGFVWAGAGSSSRSIRVDTATLKAFGFCSALTEFDVYGHVTLVEIAPGVYLDELTVDKYWGSRSEFDAVGAWRAIVDNAIYQALAAITDADKALRECNHLIDSFAPRACKYTIKPTSLHFKRVDTVDAFNDYMDFVFEFAGLIAGEVYTYMSGRDA